MSHHEPQSSHARESGYRAPLECRDVWADLNVDLAREDQNARVEGSNGESDVKFQDSREVLHPRTLADSIVVPRSILTTSMTNVASSSTKLDNHHTSQPSESGESLQVLDSDIGMGAVSVTDLIEDTKFYQDATLSYQDAYETLHNK